MMLDIPAGMSLYQAISRTIHFARRSNVSEVSIKFNGIDLLVSSTSNENDIAEIYSLKCQVERLKKGL